MNTIILGLALVIMISNWIHDRKMEKQREKQREKELEQREKELEKTKEIYEFCVKIDPQRSKIIFKDEQNEY